MTPTPLSPGAKTPLDPSGHTANQGGHKPVLLREVLDILQPRQGGIYVDGTFGGGGYSRAILESAECVVWAMDRDPEAIARGAELVRRHENRLHLIEGCFGDMARLLGERGIERVQGIALDIGVSSFQLSEAKRGFSFMLDGPLDMRMSPNTGLSAAEAVNRLDEEELADIIYVYGEDRLARRIARAIAEARRHTPITRTGELADIVRKVAGKKTDGIDPATRTFQALRIYINDEMGELKRGLEAAETLLGPGGRLAVVSFHSLEDRCVKDFLRERSGNTPRVSRHIPLVEAAEPRAAFDLLTRRAIRPTREEMNANPRARSARLRGAVRLETAGGAA